METGSEVRTEELGDVSVVTVVGELDVTSGPAFAQALDDVISADNRLVVDLHGCVFIDSWGLHTLTLARERRGKDRPIGIVVNSRVSRVFEVVGFGELFGLYVSRDAALANGRPVDESA